jgi:hypothetical protein
VHETPEDIALLDELIERSFAEAGPHLVSIATPERRLRGRAVCERLTGMSLLALATAFYFSSSRDSLRYRHLAVRPQVSATHLPGEHLAVTVHGKAVEIDLDGADRRGFRETVLEVYLPRYGDEFLKLLETGVVYWRIEADRMFTFYAPELGVEA